jgi:hypothetical protein
MMLLIPIQQSKTKDSPFFSPPPSIFCFTFLIYCLQLFPKMLIYLLTCSLFRLSLETFPQVSLRSSMTTLSEVALIYHSILLIVLSTISSYLAFLCLFITLLLLYKANSIKAGKRAFLSCLCVYPQCLLLTLHDPW